LVFQVKEGRFFLSSSSSCLEGESSG
jgi:hypothetical protein